MIEQTQPMTSILSTSSTQISSFGICMGTLFTPSGRACRLVWDEAKTFQAVDDWSITVLCALRSAMFLPLLILKYHLKCASLCFPC